MNLVNTSTRFSNFQLRLSCSPRIIPLLVPTTLSGPSTTEDDTSRAREVIERVQTDVAEAKDNLLLAKIFQTYHANIHRSPEPQFQIGDKVMLSTLHCRQEFKKKGKKWVAKFFPHYDGPYNIINEHAATLNYTLELLNNPNTYPTYHTSELKNFVPNDPCTLSWPRTITTTTNPNTRWSRRVPSTRNSGFTLMWLRMAISHTMGWLWCGA